MLQWAPGVEVMMEDIIASNVASFEIGFQGCLFGMSVNQNIFWHQETQKKV